MPERPRLHLDFNSPCTPPPIYSPYFSSSPTSPYSPPLGSPLGTPTRRSSSSSSSTLSLDSPKTPSTPKIIMGAMVFTPEPKRMNSDGNGIESEDEGESSLEVPGIVLTEPPRQPSPRLPSPPPKQVVLLAPCSLPIPSSTLSSNGNMIIPLRDSKSSSSLSSYSSYSSYSSQDKPQFSTTFMKFLGYPQPSLQQQNIKTKKSLKMTLILMIMILGCWHLWSTLEFGLTLGLVEETVVL